MMRLYCGGANREGAARLGADNADRWYRLACCRQFDLEYMDL